MLNEEIALPEADFSHLMRPAYYIGVLKRRWIYFLVPFVLVLVAGTVVTYSWPATYYSEGKILVQSQQIPAELVRPTVTSAAQERIQVIEQRTMTRDNLIAIADKFKLFPDGRSLMSPTELVEQVKKNVKIAPYVQPLSFARNSQNPTIVFTVGFEDGSAQTAARVANELMTRILNEDLRDRTNRAGETTKFLSREVQRLQAESMVIDTKIAQAKYAQVRPSPRGAAPPPDQATTQLMQLRAELAQKSSVYSEKNFQVQSLKRQIEALEKTAPPPPPPTPAATEPQSDAGLDVLEVQQRNIQLSLDAASAKLSAARLGETLERDQQSEKLEVIDQPTVPQEPIRPKRPKLLGIVAGLALLLGAGCAVGAELLDRAIRRSSDLSSIIHQDLIVSVPYIFTQTDLRRRKRKLWLVIGVSVVAVAAVAAAAYWIMPPLDLLLAKARVGLFK